MDDQGMDGMSDCELVPKKYKEGTPQEMDYVSYRVKLGGIKLIEFDLDPCPPVVCSFLDSFKEKEEG
jgi:hypothetical protein